MTKISNVFNLSAFKQKFQKQYPNKRLPSDHFLQWFIGFVEGDGCFMILNPHSTLGRQELRLEIKLHQRDKPTLDRIAEILGFGKVYKKITLNQYSYLVTNLREISVVIELFNGNIVLSKFYERFVLFVNKHNEKISNPNAWSRIKALGTIALKPLIVRPTLNDAWFSGFTDAEGCFYENLSRKPQNKSQWGYSFDVYQNGDANKELFDYFKTEFGCGSVHRRKRRDNVEYSFQVRRRDHSINIIAPYFKRFPLCSCLYGKSLKTVKKDDFDRWLVVMTVLKAYYRSRCDVIEIYEAIDEKLKATERV